MDRGGHQHWGLVAGIAEHESLVPYALFLVEVPAHVYAPGDVVRPLSLGRTGWPIGSTAIEKKLGGRRGLEF